jgi:hypothetical protein
VVHASSVHVFTFNAGTTSVCHCIQYFIQVCKLGHVRLSVQSGLCSFQGSANHETQFTQTVAILSHHVKDLEWICRFGGQPAQAHLTSPKVFAGYDIDGSISQGCACFPCMCHDFVLHMLPVCIIHVPATSGTKCFVGEQENQIVMIFDDIHQTKCCSRCAITSYHWG